MPSKIITEELKQNIINYYLSYPMTLSQVEKHFNLSHPTISKILKNTPKYPKAKINNPELKERFFQTIDNEEKAYFLGLLIADGNVFKDSTSGRQASISITLDLEDEYMLLKFKEVLNANTSIGYDGRGCGQIAIRSNLMAIDLEQYGVIPRKSLFTYLPHIDDKYMNHLIRGILDGDGSIRAEQTQVNNRFAHYIGFCGNEQLMQDISNYCIKLNLNTVPKVHTYNDKNLSDIKIQSKDDMYIFGEWLYKDATIFLKRKKDKYELFKSHYNLK